MNFSHLWCCMEDQRCQKMEAITKLLNEKWINVSKIFLTTGSRFSKQGKLLCVCKNKLIGVESSPFNLLTRFKLIKKQLLSIICNLGHQKQNKSDAES